MELPFCQLKMAQRSDELHVHRIAANRGRKTNGVGVGNLIPHGEQKRAVARNGRRLPHSNRMRSRVRPIAEIAPMVALPEYLITGVHAPGTTVVEDHVLPP